MLLKQGQAELAYTVVQREFAGKLNTGHKSQDKGVGDLIPDRAPAAPLALCAPFSAPSVITHLLYLLDHEPTKATIAQRMVLAAEERNKGNSTCMYI